MADVWYVGYGSNLCEQRFLCYIRGGTPCFGTTAHEGCTDKTPPKQTKSMGIPYRLYFALPGSAAGTGNWEAGGVAFIDPDPGKNEKTLCRMWRLTEKQYREVRNQEGGAYDEEIPLGRDCGIPIYTITSGEVLTNVLCPSDAYLKTIALGLREVYGMSDEEVARYLEKKDGIRGTAKAGEIAGIVASVRGCP